MTSSTSASAAAAGTVVGGFRIERLLGRGEMGAVYEATQLSLGRPVALRLLDCRERRSAAVHHPNIVPVYEAGEWDGGGFVAMRLMRGRPLSALLDEGALSQRRFDEVIEAVERALEAAHSTGLVHGRLAAHNVIVDSAGTPYVADFGLRRPGSAADDGAALEALRQLRPKGGRGRRTAAVAAVAGLAAVGAVTLGLALAGSDDGEDVNAAPAPPVEGGTLPLGSRLAPGPLRSAGCAPDPGANTPACIVSQSAVGGRPIEVRETGVIRRWAVRGAAGELTLNVLRRRGGRVIRVGFSQPERPPGVGPQVFATNVRVQRGDRIGVLLAPGARIGVRSRPRGTSARQWEGNRMLLPPSSRELAGELLLRADLEAGVRAVTPRQRTGSRAAAAAPGRVLEEAPVHGTVEVKLVRVGQAIAIDAFRGPRRIARIEVPDAHVRGKLLELRTSCDYRGGTICFRWQNPGEPTQVIHAYSLGRSGGAFRVIG